MEACDIVMQVQRFGAQLIVRIFKCCSNSIVVPSNVTVSKRAHHVEACKQSPPILISNCPRNTFTAVLRSLTLFMSSVSCPSKIDITKLSCKPAGSALIKARNFSIRHKSLQNKMLVDGRIKCPCRDYHCGPFLACREALGSVDDD